MSRGPHLRVNQHRRSPKESKGWYVDGNLEGFLYTLADRKPSSWPLVGVRRHVGQRRTTYATIVASWLKDCRETHADCPKNGESALPTRVLDVGQHDTDNIRLIQAAGRWGYVALSHCWGGGIAIRTTRDTLAARQRGISLEHLPKSFQDAVTVTRGLGLRYLWIDALCIIQDDLDDWARESSTMATVYRNAFFVLGADMSPDSEGGFLHRTDLHERGYDEPGTPIAVIENEDLTIYARRGPGHGNLCRIFKGSDEPLFKRVWTLQEQLLASKMVHFAGKEMVWQCLSAVRCECMQLDNQELESNELASLYRSLTHPSTTFEKYKVWYHVINAISARLEAECTPVSAADALGAVSGGRLKVCGPLVKMVCASWTSSKVFGSFTLGWPLLKPVDSGGGAGKIRPHYDVRLLDVVDGSTLYCLFLGELTAGSLGSPVRGLVLRERFHIFRGLNVFERIVSFRLSRGEEEQFIHDGRQMTTLFIV